MFIMENLKGHHVNQTDLKTEVLIITRGPSYKPLISIQERNIAHMKKNPPKIRLLNGKNT